VGEYDFEPRSPKTRVRSGTVPSPIQGQDPNTIGDRALLNSGVRSRTVPKLDRGYGQGWCPPKSALSHCREKVDDEIAGLNARRAYQFYVWGARGGEDFSPKLPHADLSWSIPSTLVPLKL